MFELTSELKEIFEANTPYMKEMYNISRRMGLDYFPKEFIYHTTVYLSQRADAQTKPLEPIKYLESRLKDAAAVGALNSWGVSEKWYKAILPFFNDPLNTRFCRIGHYQSVHQLTQKWPDDCFCQAGENGVVFVRGWASYETAFFEAFPSDPKTFIRGEGKTITEAEQSAWAQYQQYLACDGHVWDRRGRTDDHAYCSKCGLFTGGVVDFLTHCQTCGRGTNDHQGVNGGYWCEDHFRDMPLSEWSDERFECAKLEYFRKMWEVGRKSEVNL